MTWAEFFCWYALIGCVLCANYQRHYGDDVRWSDYPIIIAAWPAALIMALLPDDL